MRKRWLPTICDDADAPAGILQFGTLLNVRLQITAITRGIDDDARAIVEPRLPQRIAQLQAVAVNARVDLGVGEQGAE